MKKYNSPFDLPAEIISWATHTSAFKASQSDPEKHYLLRRTIWNVANVRYGIGNLLGKIVDNPHSNSTVQECLYASWSFGFFAGFQAAQEIPDDWEATYPRTQLTLDQMLPNGPHAEAREEIVSVLSAIDALQGLQTAGSDAADHDAAIDGLTRKAIGAFHGEHIGYSVQAAWRVLLILARMSREITKDQSEEGAKEAAEPSVEPPAKKDKKYVN